MLPSVHTGQQFWYARSSKARHGICTQLASQSYSCLCIKSYSNSWMHTSTLTQRVTMNTQHIHTPKCLYKSSHQLISSTKTEKSQKHLCYWHIHAVATHMQRHTQAPPQLEHVVLPCDKRRIGQSRELWSTALRAQTPFRSCCRKPASLLLEHQPIAGDANMPRA